MKIGLYNLEPQFVNIALEKVKAYFTSHKHTVEYCSPLEYSQYDAVYCSSLFDWTNKKYVSPIMITGGSGFDVTAKLPKEIDDTEIHINRGFTTRGCPNNCSFCIVRKKEGEFHRVGDLYSIWDGKSKKVVFYDNNVLADPPHFDMVSGQCRKHKLELDWNQGLDHRRLTPEIIDVMQSVKHKEYRFAFDNPNSISTVEKAIDLLQTKGINRCSWYVLCGYDTTLEQDLFRLNYLRSRNQNAYVQRYRNGKTPPDYLIPLARWVNQHHIFQGMTWEQFLNHPTNHKYKYLLQGE